MANENEGGKKRKQHRYLPHNKPVKKKGSYPLRPGVQGFFITCDGGREREASHEAINVIDSFFEELVEGKDISTKSAMVPDKPSNKKIKFNYSDSSDSDGEEEDDGNVEDNNDEKEKVEEKTEARSRADGDAANEDSGNVKSDQEDNPVTASANNNEDVKPDSGSKTNEVEKINVEEKSEAGSHADGNATNGGQGNGNSDQEKNPVTGSAHSNEGVKADSGSKTDEVEEPPTKKHCGGHTQDKAQMSVDKLIEAELQELGDKKKRRFAKLDSGCNGVVFIQMQKRDGDPGPKEIVQHMMGSSASTRKQISRYLLRVFPIEVACYASEEEISRAIKPVITHYFPAEAETPIKFAVLYDARANSGIDRMKIIDTVAKSVPGPHKVDLKNPEKNIVVQIVKTVCLIGVVEKYKEFAKYNLRQLTSTR